MHCILPQERIADAIGPGSVVMRYQRLWIPVCFCLALAGGACATSATPYDDTHTNDATDPGTDLTDTTDLPDAPVDSAYDSMGDTAADTGLDTAVDSGTDTGWDTGTDTSDGTGGGVVGDACYSSTQCSGVPGSGRTCLTSLMGYITFPGGYCSAVCTSAADCGAGAACVNLNDLGHYCLKQCTSATECRTTETYSCNSIPGAAGMYCIPPISSPDA